MLPLRSAIARRRGSSLRSCFALLACALLGLLASPAGAKPRKHEGSAADPSRWFATRQGLLRVYQARGAKGDASDDGSAPPAGASCEVIESVPKDGDTPARTRESCTMISGRKPKGAAQLTYELRTDGIYKVETRVEPPPGQAAPPPSDAEVLMLPAPATPGTSWSEERGSVKLMRSVKSAGKACKAADRKFGDCLVLSVVEREGGKVRRKYTETYAAGVGLVEDAQWELIDVKGL